VVCGAFDRRKLDPQFAQARTELVTRGWLRLRELAGSTLAILDYPLVTCAGNPPPYGSAPPIPQPGE
jgi:hypothetical protein